MKTIPTASTGSSINLVKDGDTFRIARIESEYRFAFELKNVARFMANKALLAREEDYYEQHAFVTGAIILSYAYLNAGFNEFIFLNATAKESSLSTTDKAIIQAMADERLRPQQGSENALQLYNVVLRLLKKPPLEDDKPPFQAANALCVLRNLLVHPEPVRVVIYDENPESILSDQQKIVKQLRSHLKLHKNATFPRDILTPACARWAVNSCELFFSEFVRRTGVNPGLTPLQKRLDKIHPNWTLLNQRKV